MTTVNSNLHHIQPRPLWRQYSLRFREIWCQSAIIIAATLMRPTMTGHKLAVSPILSPIFERLFSFCAEPHYIHCRPYISIALCEQQRRRSLHVYERRHFIILTLKL